MIRPTFLAAAGLACCLARVAAAEPDMNAGALAHSLDRLGTTARVLYVAAHPDDENTRLLAYLANVRHLQVAYLSMTRGGGGQNLIGGEQGELLDVIRTEELLAARELDGARQWFSLARDFGYSKSAEETLSRWGHEAALGDVVRVIRRFQPDVIVTRFDETPPNHGHHTASAILAREAIEAAADPQRFPEQGLPPWKVTRLLRNWGNWGNQTPPAGSLSLDVSTYDPRFGLNMGELAARSRSQHKSQGFGVSPDRGVVAEVFVPVAGTRPQKDVLDGVPLGWERYGAAGKPVTRALAEASRLLDRDHPERALPALVRADAALAKLPDDPRVREARQQLAEVVIAAAGLYLRATAPRATLVPGSRAEIALEAIARLSDVELGKITLASVEGTATPLRRGERKVVPLPMTLPADLQPSQPYWLGQTVDPAAGRYVARDTAVVGDPRAVPALRVEVEVVIGGRSFRVARPVVNAWTDPVQGERVRLVSIVPAATVTPLRDAVMFPGRKPGKVAFRVRAGQDGVKGRLSLEAPGWGVVAPRDVSLAKTGDEVIVTFDVAPGAGAIVARPVLEVGGVRTGLREDLIDHPHIPMQLVLRPAQVKLVPLALDLPRGRIGYVRGSGDSIADDLAHVGLAVEDLDDATLGAGDLDRFTAIVYGIRAYNTRPAVRAAHARVMGYVERGGTVIVQYNTQNRQSSVEGSLGPFPLELGRDRITDETAAPTLLDGKHAVFTTPNTLDATDWQGWVQERGIYFGAKWDPRYTPLLRFADPKEPPLDGALLVARHGKGRYVYTGLAFFRQLPAGVPGAYRLFCNLIGSK